MSKFKKIGGRYGMHSGSGNFKNLQADNLWVSGVPMYNVRGDIFYVDQNVAGGNGDGTTWADACVTITAALAKVVNTDSVIFIAAGTYDEATTLTITTAHNGLKLIGPNNTEGFDPAYLTDSTSSDHILTLYGVRNLEIANLAFYGTVDEKWAIFSGKDNDATSAYGVWIHDCYYYAGDGEGFFTNSNTADTPDLVIERCKLQGGNTACIVMEETRAEVRDCFIKPTAAKIGIDFTNRGSFDRISGNVISGVNSTDTGIKIASGSTAAGCVAICNNTVLNCGTIAITQDVGITNIASNNWVEGTNGALAGADSTNA